MSIIVSDSIFDCLQTFLADPDAVNGSPEVMATSVDIFFKKKPSRQRNTSGYVAPGVILNLCEVVNNVPDPTRVVQGSVVRVAYNDVYAFSDATHPTTFAFSQPVPLQTGRMYGIVLRFEDSQYAVWVNKIGDRLVGTNRASSGSGNVKDGKYYQKTNTKTLTPLNNIDLKYCVKVARYTANSTVVDLCNRHYEYFVIADLDGRYRGGEWVYKDVTNAGGTLAVVSGNNTIIGTGTTFTSIVEGNYIVALNTSTAQVLQVDSVINATAMTVNTTPNFTNATASWKIAPVGRVSSIEYPRNRLHLVDSTANSTLLFEAGTWLVGEISGTRTRIISIESRVISDVAPMANVAAEASASVTYEFNCAVDTGGSVVFDVGEFKRFTPGRRVAGTRGPRRRPARWRMLSRSLEVNNINLYLASRRSLSCRLTVNVNSNSVFTLPTVNPPASDVFTYEVMVSNAYMNNGIDTEVYKNGLAVSKAMTKKVSFANNRFAEDLRVYMQAFRPANTDIRVYAKLHNSNDPETFDDKLWTPLVAVQNGNRYSSAEDKNDIIEYEFGLQQYPDTANTLPGSFTTTLNDAVIIANGVDPSTYLTTKDLVKVYNPLVLENFMVTPVAAVNSTAITLGDEVANNGLVGSGFVVDRLRYTGTAFNNYINGNTCRYFTSTLAEVDKFDSMQFKIVLLADSAELYPEVESFEAIGINAGVTQ